MGRKIRFLLIFLIGIILASIFVILQVYTSKQAVITESDNLKKGNASLSEQIQKMSQENKLLQDRLSALHAELDRVSSEREEIKKQYELLDKARGGLLEKLKSQQVQEKMIVPQAEPAPRTDDAYWAGILKEKTELELQLQNIRNEFKAMQGSYEQLQKDSRKLAQNLQLVDALAADLVREKNDKIQIQNTLKLMKGENAALKKQLKSIVTRKTNLERNLKEAGKTNTSLQNRINEMDALLNDKNYYIENLAKQIETGQKVSVAAEEKKPSIELPPIVVRPDTRAITQKAVLTEGRVLSVNRENNFVIIDLGEDSGIKSGDTFQVYREGKPIASIEIIQVRPKIAAGDIKKEAVPIEAADTVK